jgi:hypothetical protein
MDAAAVSAAGQLNFSTNVWHTFHAVSPQRVMSRGNLAATRTPLGAAVARLLALSLIDCHNQSIDAARAQVRQAFVS